MIRFTDAIRKEEVENVLKDIPERAFLCPDCYKQLKGSIVESGVGVLYCPNEMCLNEKAYDLWGIEIVSN